MSAEADVGFLGQGEVVGIGNECKVTRGWSTQRGWWPSPRVECTLKGEWQKGQGGRGELQTKVVSVIPEMERIPSEVLADVVRFRPRTNREVLAPVQARQAPEVSAPGKASAVLRNSRHIQIVNLKDI